MSQSARSLHPLRPCSFQTAVAVVIVIIVIVAIVAIIIIIIAIVAVVVVVVVVVVVTQEALSLLVEMSIQHDPTAMHNHTMHDHTSMGMSMGMEGMGMGIESGSVGSSYMHGGGSGYMHDRFTFNTAMHGKIR